MLRTDHLDAIRNIYSRIGLTDEGIESRIMQGMRLVHANDIGSQVGNSGKGVGCAWDSQTKAYFPPMIAADDNEARALRRVINQMTTDADTPVFNMSSSGAPLPLLTIWTQRVINQIFKKTTLKELAGDFQQGTFGIRQIKIPVIGQAGEVVLYNDNSMNGSNTYNVTYVSKDILYFETSLNYGDLEVAEWSISKLDAIQMKRNARDTVTVPQFQNDLGFNGYTATDVPQISGIINNPNLNASTSIPNDGRVPATQALTTAWSGKDYSQIIRDVQLLVSKVIVQGLGNVNSRSRFKLAIPPSADVAMQTSTTFGTTVNEQLKKMFPGIEVVVVPNFEANLNATGQTIAMVLFENPETGEMPFVELFTTKYMAHRPVPMASSMAEKISMGLGGSMLLYPLYVSYGYGV